MAIITFKSNELKETGQTLSLAAVATQMSIEHSYKILIVSTNFKDQTLENCFWELDKLAKPIISDKNHVAIGVDSGVEGLIKVLASNKTSKEIVRNYSKTILRDRLDMLLSPSSTEYQVYSEVCKNYQEILQIADRYYDLIFVDLSNRMPKQDQQNILDISDLVIYNISQRLKTINDYMEEKEYDDNLKRRNCLLLIGKYDSYSKYNVKNITRYLKEKRLILDIPYNTLFFESCCEGKIIDFFLKLKNVDQDDRNRNFITEVNRANESIIYKLQELQVKI